jgi:hypothetical protein
MSRQKVIICTVVALTFGLIGGYVGGRLKATAQMSKCQSQAWGVKQACQVMVTPGAVWYGSTTGIWTGSVIGAFAGGSLSRKVKR